MDGDTKLGRLTIAGAPELTIVEFISSYVAVIAKELISEIVRSIHPVPNFCTANYHPK